MSSVIEICNLGLSHVGGYSIESLDEPKKEARECKRLYLPACMATLEISDWGFARKRTALALLTDTLGAWEYVYAWPSDCAMPRKIYDPAALEDGGEQSDPVPFEQGINDALNKRTIATNMEDAILIYTAKVVDANMYPASFVDALGWRLAADLAIPLRSDSKMREGCLVQFRQRLGEAGVSSANAEHRKASTTSSYEQAR